MTGKKLAERLRREGLFPSDVYEWTVGSDAGVELGDLSVQISSQIFLLHRWDEEAEVQQHLGAFTTVEELIGAIKRLAKCS